MKFSAQIQKAVPDAYPLLATVHGWSVFFLILIALFGFVYSVTRYKRWNENTHYPLTETR